MLMKIDYGYVHTITFSHRFLLFGSKLELPWDCGTIENDAKTLPCARSLYFTHKSLEGQLKYCKTLIYYIYFM